MLSINISERTTSIKSEIKNEEDLTTVIQALVELCIKYEGLKNIILITSNILLDPDTEKEFYNAYPIQIDNNLKLSLIDEQGIKQFIELTARVREAQKKYYSSRASVHLSAAKNLEKQLDKLIEKINKPTQNNLF